MSTKINDNIVKDSRYLLIKYKIHYELSGIKAKYITIHKREISFHHNRLWVPVDFKRFNINRLHRLFNVERKPSRGNNALSIINESRPRFLCEVVDQYDRSHITIHIFRYLIDQIEFRLNRKEIPSLEEIACL